MTHANPARLSAALILGLVLFGCGFKAQHTLGPERPSLGITIFANEGREPDLERRLHRHLTQAAQHLIDAPLVAPSHADVTLKGSILDYRLRGGVRGKENILLERGVNLTIEAALWDSGGLLIAGPVTLRQDVGFTSLEAGGRRSAEERVLANLAKAALLDLLVELKERRLSAQDAPKTP